VLTPLLLVELVLVEVEEVAEPLPFVLEAAEASIGTAKLNDGKGGTSLNGTEAPPRIRSAFLRSRDMVGDRLFLATSGEPGDVPRVVVAAGAGAGAGLVDMGELGVGLVEGLADGIVMTGVGALAAAMVLVALGGELCRSPTMMPLPPSDNCMGADSADAPDGVVFGA